MKNIIDYTEINLKTFDELPFTAVDSLVLSQFAYMDFTDMVPSLDSKTKQVALGRLFCAEHFEQMLHNVWAPESCRRLLTAMAANPRFRDIGVNFYVDRLDTGEEKQFSAITFVLGDGTAYIAFRGTDTTVVGWKEDFNMAFMSPIPSQTDAVEYLNAVGHHLKNPAFRVGGHSKGGNLAVYSAMKCKPSVRARIREVYSHDGPGFRLGVFSSDDYKQLKDRICKTMPASSVIGMLLENQEEYRVVESNGFGILQHDPFSWKVEKNDFVDAKHVSSTALYTSEAIRSWLHELPDEEREKFADTLFDLISATKADSFNDLIDNWQKEAAAILQAIKSLDTESGRFLMQTIKALAVAAVRSIRLPELPELQLPKGILETRRAKGKEKEKE